MKYWLAFVSGLLVSAMAWLMLHEAGTRPARPLIADNEARIANEQAWSIIPGKSGDDTKDSRSIIGETLREKNAPQSGSSPKNDGIAIRVYLEEDRTIETLPLEDYVAGVVAAEMPLDFKPAALEAQAMAARTYIVRRLWLHDRSGVPVDGADVTNTQTHQVYKSQEDMKKLQDQHNSEWHKVEEAVKNTEGRIIVYGDEPIEALFFSTSNGFTENSEEVFSMKLPYLRSVASPWDKANSPRAEETVEMSMADFYSKIGLVDVPVGASANTPKTMRILEWTPGRRVKEMVVGGKKLSGTEARHMLGLRSAAFDWSVKNGNLTLTTFGSGHGVGMSQWGAEGMAEAGKTARQIVEYYYTGVRTEEVSKLALGL
ncbi:stage II sporulation protein D [Cohnella endophytica]|uniref:Stage II sporulation protein D n=1 Tax=Cohnella endophytica TaxID=2419778 RepID=A0A494X976_9BACL|nr:stage II sporulation protein D [Cohnella endophytica]RKP47287.1 stage II sporulation protein D [Cohnella endophytica]